MKEKEKWLIELSEMLRGWRIFVTVVSVAFIVAGISVWIFTRNIVDVVWYIELGKLLSGAAIVIGVGLLISEWPKITRFLLKGLEAIIKREIKTLGERVLNEYKVGFSQRASDVKFLGDFTPDTLKDFRNTITKALFKHPVDRIFLSAIEEELYPSLDRPCRYEYNIILTHVLKVSPSGIPYIDVTEKTFWTYKNFSGKETAIKQPFIHWLKRIDGIKDKELFQNTAFNIDGVNKDKDLVFSGPQWNPKIKELQFKAEYHVSIEDKPIKVVREYKKKIPRDDHYRFFVYHPIQNLYFTYSHPSDLKPTFFVFGIKGELECITDGPTLHVWHYKGCLFRRHGYVLIWSHSSSKS